MNTYRPDGFNIIRLRSAEGEVRYRVFSSWRGGFTTGDSWRLNSGIASYSINEEGLLEFKGNSGSVYTCSPSHEGRLGAYGTGVLNDLLGKTGNDIVAEVISFQEFTQEFDKDES